MLKSAAKKLETSFLEIFESPKDRESTLHNVHLHNTGNDTESANIQLYLAREGTYFDIRQVDLDPHEDRCLPRSINLGPGDKILAKSDLGNVTILISAYVDEETGSMNHFNPRGKWHQDREYGFLDVVDVQGKSYVVSDYDGVEAGVEPSEAFGGRVEGSSWERLVSGISWRGPWKASKTYYYMDMVTYGNDAFLCTEDDVEGVRPNRDERWYRAISRVSWCGVYDPASSYKAFDMVSYEGQSWIAKEELGPGDRPGQSSGWEVMSSAPKKVDELEELVLGFDDRIRENEESINHLRNQSIAMSLIF